MKNISKALLIIDIQNDYFKDGAMELVGAKQASENAKLILEKFRNEKSPIIHIQHIAGGKEATFFLPNTKGAEIHYNVQPKDNEKVIVKHNPNSFRETELLEYLISNDISELVICGMMTHMCVDTTTRAAYDLGFMCTLIGDACATKDLEFDAMKVNSNEVQISYMAALDGTFADVKFTEEYLNG
jgi:nicotinamidase-related amidase